MILMTPRQGWEISALEFSPRPALPIWYSFASKSSRVKLQSQPKFNNTWLMLADREQISAPRLKFSWSSQTTNEVVRPFVSCLEAFYRGSFTEPFYSYHGILFVDNVVPSEPLASLGELLLMFLMLFCCQWFLSVFRSQFRKFKASVWSCSRRKPCISSPEDNSL